MRIGPPPPRGARVGARWALALLVILPAVIPIAAIPSSARADDAAGVPFLIRFRGSVRGLAPGAPVEVRGVRIGAVTSVGVEYAADGNSFLAPVEILLQPGLFPAAGGPHPRTAAEIYEAAEALVRRGLRAQVSSTQLLGGGDTVVTFDIEPDSPPATLDRRGRVPELPAGPTPREMLAQKLQPLLDRLADVPIDQVFADLQASMAALKQLATGPELRGALEELRGASADLRGMVNRLGPRSDALVTTLNETVRSTNRLVDKTVQTLGAIDVQVGERSPLLADVRGLVQQMDGAARSLRLMAEYLERNPNALLTGKTDNRR